MHYFAHEETGVTINFNSDYSGDAMVTLPVGYDIDVVYEEGGRTEVKIPAKALAEFSRHATVRELVSKLEDME